MNSWKTTLAGFLSAAGILFAQQFPQWSKWGMFASGMGTLLMGLSARDNDKSSEDVGAADPYNGRPTSRPALNRTGTLTGMLFVLLIVFWLPGCARYSHTKTHPDGAMDRTSFTSFLMLGKASSVRSATSETNGYKRTVSVGSLEVQTETEKLSGLAESIAAGVAKGLK